MLNRACVALLWLLAGACAAMAQSSTAQSSADPKTLYPRVETGLHEGDINRMALLPGGAGVVTVSDDKSARVWAVDTLAAKGVIRPPIGPRDDGALYAVAANAKLIAVAGRVRDAAGYYAIQFFAAVDNRPVGSIDGLPEPVLALAFSPDGGTLAAGLMDGGGVRFFDLKTRQPIPPDTKYDASVTAMAFDPAGRLATAEANGPLRLYDAGGHPIGTPTPLRGGAHPYGIAFSPDGRTLAVGDRQHDVVHLFTVNAAGRLAQEADLQGAPARAGSFDFVAFSTDGHTVFAAGSYKDAAGQRFIRHWSLDGRSAAETAVADDTVTALLPAADGMLFSTAEPAVGRLDASGRVAARIGTRHIDFRNADMDAFRVSFDGSTVQMPISGQPSPGKPRATLLFDVRTRSPNASEPAGGRMTLPFASVAGLSVTEWFNSHAPKLNNNAIGMQKDETSHAVAVMPDGSGAAIGTDFFVRFVTPAGEKWRQVVSSAAFAVNISGDGRVVVAGLGDGTVHWYDSNTGKELIALYVDPPSDRFARGRFVVWTPDGFFDHDHPNDGGPDGRSLIGYQYNAPDHRSSKFVQIGQFYSRFFRPDLVGLAFRNDAAARRVAEAQQVSAGTIRQAIDTGLPAQIALVDACGRDGSSKASGCPTARPFDEAKTGGLQTVADTVLVQWKLTDPNGKPGSVRIQRDGAVLAPAVFVDDEDAHSRTEEAMIPLGEGANTISITPLGAGGLVEAPDSGKAEIIVVRAPAATRSVGGSAATPAPVPTRPVTTLYLLSVGVSHFSNPALDLPNATRDATSVADLMDAASPPVYDLPVVKLLTDSHATAANILAALRDIAKNAQPDDLVLIFLAGHGQAVDGKYYFAPSELGTANPALLARAVAPMQAGADLSDHPVDELFRREGLSQDDILAVVRTIKAARVALVLDTCFSAALATQDAVLRRDTTSTVTYGIGQAAGRFVLASAQNVALDSAQAGPGAVPTDAEGHGLFTSFFLQALNGLADYDRKGRISVDKLANYTIDHVETATANMAQVQEPMFFFNGNKFFAVRATSIGTAR
jgi:WD40 repeat protein/uncharacterized caspase-like protein